MQKTGKPLTQGDRHQSGVHDALVAKFVNLLGGKSAVCHSAIQVLYSACADFDESIDEWRAWRKTYGAVCGFDLDDANELYDQLAKSFQISAAGKADAHVLFAIHTYFALVLRLFLSNVLAPGSLQVAKEDWATQILRIESGELLREAGVVPQTEDDPFRWLSGKWHGAVGSMLAEMANSMEKIELAACEEEESSSDWFKDLYHSLLPRMVRKRLGEYYTPDWLTDHTLETIGYDGQPSSRVLDPSCGSGTFLIQAIARIRRRVFNQNLKAPEVAEEKSPCEQIVASVVGYDLNPLAVLSARANYLIAIRDLLRKDSPVSVPVYLHDSILDDEPSVHPGLPLLEKEPSKAEPEEFDYIVGNPPWILWDELPEQVRRQTLPYWKDYGLFSLTGKEARHGGGKKNMSMLLLYAVADKYLKVGGKLAFVINQSLFQSRGAGDGFRRFKIGTTGCDLKVLRVDDMVALQPFPGAANWTSVLFLEKGKPTAWPVSYFRWDKSAAAPTGKVYDECQAAPIDSGAPTSPWFVRKKSSEVDVARMIGKAEYQAHLGANSGGANGVFWLKLLEKQGSFVLAENLADEGKRHVEQVRMLLEPERLFPLLRWGDVARFNAAPKAHILITQDTFTRTGIAVEAMQARFPRTFSYLERFREVLEERAAYRKFQAQRAYYSMYDVAAYTVAPLKVVWRRMDRQLNAAVVESIDDPLLGNRPVIPQETCVLIPVELLEEAHYICALLNSSIVGEVISSQSVRGGKGFGSPGFLDFVRIPKFQRKTSIHRRLAKFSMEAHDARRKGESYALFQSSINELAETVWK